jgi:hypothetical protein
MNEIIISEPINTDNIIYNIENINYFTDKIILYNANSTIPLHKFWVYINKSKVVKILSINKIKTLFMALSVKNDFTEHIKMIESKCNDKLKSDNVTKINVSSKLVDFNKSFPVMELSLDSETIMFDLDNNKKDIMDLNVGTELELICELENFIYSTKSLKSTWRIVQLKKTRLIDLNVPLFDKISKPVPVPVPVPPVIHIQPIATHQITQHCEPSIKSALFAELTNNTTKLQKVKTVSFKDVDNSVEKQESKQVSSGRFMMSPKDLQNALSGLKKIKMSENIEEKTNDTKTNDTKTNDTKTNDTKTNDTKTNDTKTNDTNIETHMESPLSQLKHVKTKEFSAVQFLKDEYKMNEQYNEIKQLEKLRKKMKR